HGRSRRRGLALGPRGRRRTSMKQQLLTALGSKVVVGVGATVLAFGTAGTVVALQPASDSSHADVPFVATDDSTTTSTTAAPTTTSTTSTTVAPTTTTTAHDADDDHGLDDADHPEHPENHGREVSEAAHARNAA